MSKGDIARLVVTLGPNAGETLLLPEGRATIGRQGTNDLVLDDPGVASVHIELERRDAGRVLVRDRSGGNTWLGANRIIEAELAPGSIFRLGDSWIKIEANASDAVSPAAPPALRASRSSWSPTRLATIEEELAGWADSEPTPTEAERHSGRSGVESAALARRGSSRPSPTLGALCEEARLDLDKSPFDRAYAGACEQLPTDEGATDAEPVPATPATARSPRFEVGENPAAALSSLV